MNEGGKTVSATVSLLSPCRVSVNADSLSINLQWFTQCSVKQPCPEEFGEGEEWEAAQRDTRGNKKCMVFNMKSVQVSGALMVWGWGKISQERPTFWTVKISKAEVSNLPGPALEPVCGLDQEHPSTEHPWHEVLPMHCMCQPLGLAQGICCPLTTVLPAACTVLDPACEPCIAQRAVASAATHAIRPSVSCWKLH